MSRLSEVRSMQQEREKNIADADMRELCNILERINGNLEDLSTSMAMLVDNQTKGK